MYPSLKVQKMNTEKSAAKKGLEVEICVPYLFPQRVPLSKMKGVLKPRYETQTTNSQGCF